MKNNKQAKYKSKRIPRIVTIVLLTILIVLLVIGIGVDMRLTRRIKGFAANYDKTTMMNAIDKEIEGYLNSRYVSAAGYNIESGNQDLGLSQDEIDDITKGVSAISQNNMTDDVYEGTATLVARDMAQMIRDYVTEYLAGVRYANDTIAQAIAAIAVKNVSYSMDEYINEINENKSSLMAIKMDTGSMKEKMGNLEATAQNLKDTYSTAISDLQKADSNLSTAISNLDTAKVSQSEIQAIVKKLNSSIDDTKDKIEETEDALNGKIDKKSTSLSERIDALTKAVSDEITKINNTFNGYVNKLQSEIEQQPSYKWDTIEGYKGNKDRITIVYPEETSTFGKGYLDK